MDFIAILGIFEGDGAAAHLEGAGVSSSEVNFRLGSSIALAIPWANLLESLVVKKIGIPVHGTSSAPRGPECILQGSKMDPEFENRAPSEAEALCGGKHIIEY
mgnify:CR=1 FL=1